MPERCKQFWTKLYKSRTNQFRGLPEITEKIDQQNVHLPLPSLEVAWIQVA